MWFTKKQQEKFEELDTRYLEVVSENIELKERIESIQEECNNLLRKKEDIENVYQEIRKLKHDMRNHLMVISLFLNDGKYEEAREYTSSFISKIELDFSYISSGNSLLNYILNEKFSVAKNHGIYIKANIENIKFSKILGIDFAAILTNLLDNAIEAAEKSKEKQLYVQVRKIAGYSTIKVSNSINESVLSNNPGFITSKKIKGEHGIGFTQVKSLMDKYEGIYDIWEENGMFHVQIMFEES